MRERVTRHVTAEARSLSREPCSTSPLRIALHPHARRYAGLLSTTLFGQLARRTCLLSLRRPLLISIRQLGHPSHVLS